MQDVFLNGLTALAAPPVPVVMGLTLRPFSLGHSVLLEAIDSPFVIGGGVSLSDLSLSAWICSKTYEAASVALLSGDQEKPFKKWGHKWAKRGDFSKELEMFRVYIRHYSKAPEQWQTESKPSAIPWQWHLLNALSGGVADPQLHSRILNMPINAAVCQYAAIASAGGDKSLMTEEEINGIAELERIANV